MIMPSRLLGVQGVPAVLPGSHMNQGPLVRKDPHTDRSLYPSQREPLGNNKPGFQGGLRVLGLPPLLLGQSSPSQRGAEPPWFALHGEGSSRCPRLRPVCLGHTGDTRVSAQLRALVSESLSLPFLMRLPPMARGQRAQEGKGRAGQWAVAGRPSPLSSHSIPVPLTHSPPGLSLAKEAFEF